MSGTSRVKGTRSQIRIKGRKSGKMVGKGKARMDAEEKKEEAA